MESAADERYKCMEHWWNETGRDKHTYSKKNLSLWHLIYYEFHMYWPGIEPGTPW
jgi:hypothetical protein